MLIEMKWTVPLNCRFGSPWSMAWREKQRTSDSVVGELVYVCHRVDM